MREFVGAGALVVEGGECSKRSERMRLRSRQWARVDFAVISASSLGWLTLMDPGVVAGQTSSCPGIHVTILNIRNASGNGRLRAVRLAERLPA